MDRTHSTSRHSGAGVVLRGFLLTSVLGLAAALLGWVLDGPAAGLGVVVGTLSVVVICATGSLLVDAVAGALPAASLMVALLTYTLQVLLVLLVFAGLERSGALGSTLDRDWLGGAAIGATLAWLGTQVLLTVRSRIPVFDPPLAEARVTPVAGGSRGTEGGER